MALVDQLDFSPQLTKAPIRQMSTKNVHNTPKWFSERIRIALAKQDRRLISGMGFSGFDDFDQMAGGLWPGDLIVFGGSPDMGKTALALNISEYLAFKECKAVVYFSSDLMISQLEARTLCSEGRISLHNIRTGELTVDERGRLDEAVDLLADGRLHFDYEEDLSVHQICSRATEYSRKCGSLGLVVVDYLQRLGSEQNRLLSTCELEETLQILKTLAQQLLCPVIALWQLPLKVEMRWNKRPVLGDLGSVKVIQKCVDTVVLLYRDEVYSREDCQQPGLVNLIFPIRRDGSSRETKMVFLSQIAKFETLAYQI